MSLRTFLFTTLLLGCHSPRPLHALINEVPRQTAPAPAHSPAESLPEAALPDAPAILDADGHAIPVAVPVAATAAGRPIHIQAAQQQIDGHIYTLLGEVTIDYRGYTVRADKVKYNQETGDVEAEGHLQVEGPGDERIQADHGTLNVDIDAARFYNVVGSVGVRTAAARRTVVYTGINPFLFTGRVVIQEGPRKFKIIDGTMTSCRLPHPDWRIAAGEIFVGNGLAYARNSTFRLLNIPILYLPYVTHPLGESDRESGFLVPVYSNSNIKGTVIGEQFFWVINRSTDLNIGLDYYSKRGWAPSGELRYRGRDENYAEMRFTALADRLGEGGTDISFQGWRGLDAHTRAVSNLEYLSSYAYRNTFASNFSQAVASQVDSTAFITRNEDNGTSESLDFSRYTSYQSTAAGADILISHQPELDYSVLPRTLAKTPITFQLNASVGGLNRREPGQPGEAQFKTSQEVGRIDAHPVLTLPLHLDGWSFRPSIGLRETFYSSSQSPGPDIPVYRDGSANRKAVEAGFDLRPPAMERDFSTPWLARFLGSRMRHVVEPQVEYTFRSGIDNFPSILRFDATDVVSDTNEVRYSISQRFYFNQAAEAAPACSSKPVPLPVAGKIYLPLDYRECGGSTSAWISWNVTGAYFFNPDFSHAILPFRRNVLDATLDLSGISFLSGTRNYAPVISRLALHTTKRVTAGWDLDYDTRAGRIDNSNLYATFRQGNYFGSVSEDLLNALQSQSNAFLAQPASTLSALATQVSRFTPVTAYNQVQLLAGYGYDTKRGFSAGLNAGYDYQNSQLQYGGAQTTYNWDCCGLTLEYRRLALGSLRNENYESFNFTLAGVGTAGNTNRSQLIY